MQLLERLDGVQIGIVSFTSSIESIRQWKSQVEGSFRIFLNSDRSLYRYFSFRGRAFSRVWNISTLDYYVQQKVSGRTLPTKLDPHDDPNQLGGDVLVDREGKILLLYRSANPTDRPSLEQLRRC